MSKGTTAKGKRNKIVHQRCRRCGRNSYHIRDKVCSACGFGRTKRIRSYSWKNKKNKGKIGV